MKYLLRLAVLLLALGAAAPAIAAPNNTLPLNGDVLMCSGRPWIDVKCNGAVGDGVADDTAAINTTVAAAITGNFPVHFPAGTYKVTSKITIDYAGIAANGLEIISRGAIIDGRSVASGPVVQLQCSGGTTGAPVTCSNFASEGDLYIQANTPAYAVIFGKADFSDIHNAVKLEHLVVTNASVAAAAGGIQYNYVTNSDLWQSGMTAGGSASIGGVALEQVSGSAIKGAGTTAGPNSPALVLEGGTTASNGFMGFVSTASGAGGICLSITSPTAARNSFIAPSGTCAVSVNGSTSGNDNRLIGPSFTATTPGPLSGGISMVGRGALSRYSQPATANLSVFGVDDGTIVSSLNATGPSTQFTAASLPVTLPLPSQVGPGWTMGFVSDANKAIVISAPVGATINSGGQALSTLTIGAAGANGNFETAVLNSDGINFRVTHLSQGATLLNGLSATFPGARWEFPGGPGYQATLGDNGAAISSGLASGPLAVTLPSTTSLKAGWSVAVAQDAGNQATINVNGTAGGLIVRGSANLSVTTAKTLYNGQVIRLQFDGANFREGSSPAPSSPTDIRLYGADPTGVADSGPAFQAAYNANVGCIFVPVGTYLINTASNFNGNHVPCFKGDGWDETMLGGTKIHITNQSIIPFSVTGNARGDGGFYDMAFYQDQPPDAPGWAPNPYQYIISVNNLIGMLNFKDLFFYNTTHCISVTGTGRETFDHIAGEPVGTCIFADNHADILYLDRIDFWVFQAPTANQQHIIAYNYANVDPVVFKRVDGPMIGRYFIIGYHSGLKLDSSASGVTNQLMAESLYLDGSLYGLWITGTNTTYSIGNMVTGAGTLLSTGPTILAGSMAFRDDSVQSRGYIGALDSHGTGDTVIFLSNTGGGGRLDIGSLRVDCFNQDNTGKAIISLANAIVGAAPHTFGSPLFPTIACDFATSLIPANQFTNFNGPIVFTNTNGIYRVAGVTTLTSPTLDTANTPFTIPQGTISPLSMSGLYLLTESPTTSPTGDSALFLLGGAAVNLISSTKGIFVASASPAFGKIGVAYNAGCSCYQIIGNMGGPVFATAQLLRTANFP